MITLDALGSLHRSTYILRSTVARASRIGFRHPLLYVMNRKFHTESLNIRYSQEYSSNVGTIEYQYDDNKAHQNCVWNS